MQGTSIDANQRYIAADYPPYPNQADYPSSAFLAQDGGVEQVLNLDLPFTTSGATAQRLAKMTLLRGREQMTFSAEFGLNAFDVEVGDIIALDMDRYGWTAKEFEVVGWRFGANGDAGDLRVTLTLRETSEAAFSWDAEESEIIGNDTNLDLQPEVVTGLSATADGVINSDGTFLNFIDASWDFNDGASGYQVEYRENGISYSTLGGRVEESDAVTTREQFIYKAYVEVLYRQPDQNGFDYYNTGAGSSLTEDEVREELEGFSEKDTNTFSGSFVSTITNAYKISAVKDDTLYDIRVRALSEFGRPGPWTATTFDTGKDGSVPNAPTNLVAAPAYGGATITWDAPTANEDASALNDLFLYEVYRGTATNPTTLVGRVAGETFTDSGLDDDSTYFYRVKARDFSGNTSAFSANLEVATKGLQDAVNAYLSSDAHLVPSNSDGSSPDFTGATTDMTVLIGGTDDTANWTFSRVNSSGVSSTISFNSVAITGMTVDSGYVDITASKSGFADVTRRYSLSKAKQGLVGGDGVDGDDGSSPVLVEFTRPAVLLPAASDGTVISYSGSGGIFRVYEGSNALTIDTTPDVAEWTITNVTLDAGYLSIGNILQTFGSEIARVYDHSNMTTDSAIIKYTIEGKRSDGSAFSTTYRQSIAKVKEGDDGAPGADGADGADGENGLSSIITNGSHVVPAGKSGVVTSYAGSGTDIYLYDGDQPLLYNSSSTASDGFWWVTSTTVSPTSAITVGSLADSGSYLTVSDHSSMDVDEDTVTITYNISYNKFNGTTGTTSIIQSITKSSAGADGAGRWNIPVASLPTSSSQAQTAWDASSVVDRDPVESDQAWFYTGTEANPTGQSVWLYDSGTSSWNEQDEVIDGNLLVTGTVTSDKVETGFIDAFTINANNITTGTLTADRINIDNVTLDTNVSNQLIIKTAGVDTNEIAVEAVSVPTSVVRSGSIPPAGAGIAVNNNATLGSTTIVREGGPMRIQFDFTIQLSLIADQEVVDLRISIYRNGSTLRTLGDFSFERVGGNSQLVSVFAEDPPITGSNTYTLRISNLSTSDGSVIVENVSTFALETKR